jgi:hypothetical protein
MVSKKITFRAILGEHKRRSATLQWSFQTVEKKRALLGLAGVDQSERATEGELLALIILHKQI